MKQTEERYYELARKWKEGSMTPEEAEEYATWFNEDDNEPLSIPAAFAKNEEALKRRIGKGIKTQPPARVSKMPVPLRRTIAAAAAFVLLIGGYWIYNHQQPGVKTNKELVQHDVEAPKTTKAMITLADGSSVALDSLNNGTLAMQGNVRVVKNAQGEISYQITDDRRQTTEAVYNTLYNPKGSKVVSLTLNDGTRVWLNAESSLQYPVAFTGEVRKVKISGEAYFEVKPVNLKGQRIPFTVQLPDGSTVEDLSTEFNINSYSNEESIKTTLIEGKIKITSSKLKAAAIMKAGQQCYIPNSSAGIGAVTDDANTEQVTAWKTGLFSFRQTGLSEVLKQLERWYDVEVVYASAVPQRKFGGEIQRELSLSKVLHLLEQQQVKFRIEGRKLIVE